MYLAFTESTLHWLHCNNTLGHQCLTRVPAVLVGAQVRLHLHSSSGNPGRETIHGARGGVDPPTAGAARHHVGQVRPERRREEAVDDGVAARVEVAKDKQYVVDILGRVLDHVWLEPIPDPQQVVRRPTDDEGADDDHGHLQGLHPRLGDHVCSTASEALLAVWRHTT